MLAVHDSALQGASEADVLRAREGLREAWSLLYSSSPWVAISNAWTDLGAHLAEAVARTEAVARPAGTGSFRLTYGLIAGDLFQRLERVSGTVAHSLSRLFPPNDFEAACEGIARLCVERAFAGVV